MSDKEPIAYEKWEIISPHLPPHSRLYALEPIGIGTPWVESLSGYIARLAEAHCVSICMLFRKEIDALTGIGSIFNSKLEGNGGYRIHAINGRGAPAKNFVRALESLTSRSGLRYLTLLPWEEVLPKIGGGFQRRARAWCAQCLCMWRAEAKPVYEPLLWTLTPVTFCPLHRQALSFVCPLCKRQNGVLDPRTRPGHCSRCRQWLAQTPIPEILPDSPVLTSDDLSWGDWVATVFGEILAAAPRLPFTPTRESFAQGIRLCVEHIANGDKREFARELGVGHRHVRKWQMGNVLPKCSSLLCLAYRLGTSLLDLFKGTPSCVSRKFMRPFPPQLSQKQFTSRKPRRTLGELKLGHALHILQTAMSENPPPSARQVIKRTNHNSAIIYRHFPEECRTLTQRFTEYQKIQAAARKDRARAEIREAAYQLHAKGIKITHRHLRPLMTSSAYTNLEEGRAALQQVREELQQSDTCRSGERILVLV